MECRVYFVSDQTGLTIEALGRSLLSQFDKIEFEFLTASFIEDAKQAESLVQEINDFTAQVKHRPIVFSSLVDPEVRKIFAACKARYFDLFQQFLTPLEKELGVESNFASGLTHGVFDDQKYMARIESIDFALNHDDGLRTEQYQQADIILIGVSRSGKTPTSLYLAIQFSIYAANYPLTSDDLQKTGLPDCLYDYKDKLFGLLISPERLSDIRQERYPGSRYASVQQCKQEVSRIQQLYFQEKIPYLETTQASIEEIATRIIKEAQIKKKE
jgi:[pyruvate, water dikinase]-phosphate phosphotransferase / [pyruvate, water dikinase] kinase